MSMDSSSRKRKLDTERASSDEVNHDDGHLLISLFLCSLLVVVVVVFFWGGWINIAHRAVFNSCYCS